jgi:flavin-dependent dehydrogenase
MLPFSSRDIKYTRITGAHIHGPSDTILTIGGDKTHAYSINRTRLDQRFAECAEKRGVDIYLGEKILSVQRISNKIELETSKKRCIQTPLVMGADGPYSKVRDLLTFQSPKEYLRGIGAEITQTNLEPHFVELFVGTKVAPGFFAWMIPTSDDGCRANIGLCTTADADHPPMYYFKKLLTDHKTQPFVEHAEITRQYGGIIPLGPLSSTYDDNIMLIGDAAAQVKPTSGGGIYPGLVCANHCADIALRAIRKDDFSASFLKQYQDRWIKEIGRELKLGMTFRRIFRRITDEQLEMYLTKFREKKMIHIISKYGDIDYPSKLIGPLLKKSPSLLKFIPQILKK